MKCPNCGKEGFKDGSCGPCGYDDCEGDGSTVRGKVVAALGSEQKADGWLTAPNRALNGCTPQDVLSVPSGRERVLQVLGRLEHGVHS